MKIKARILIKIVHFFLKCFWSVTLLLSTGFLPAVGIELADVVSFQVNEIYPDTQNLQLTLITKDQFKIYQENLSFELIIPETLPQTLHYKADPKAKLVFDSFSNKKKNIFENGTIFTLQLKSTSLEGKEKILISVQGCSTGVCLLPGKLEVSVESNAKSELSKKSFGFTDFSNSEQKVQTLSPNSTKPKLPESKISDSKQSDSKLSDLVFKFLKSGSIFLFPLLLLAGFLTNLTPCVYPMIPITIGVINHFGKNYKSTLRLSLVYISGMILAYSLLGVAAAMTGHVFGSQLASPIFSILIAIVMCFLGLAMLDLFDLSFLQRLSYKIQFSEKSPLLAVGTMGAISGLVAAPCTGPILSMILLLIAQTRDPVKGFMCMLFFATGFGLPYVFLGFLSQRLTKLPKLDRISIVIKLIFASLMFALALYYLKIFLIGSSVLNFIYVKPEVSDVIAIIAILFLLLEIKQPKFKFLLKLEHIAIVSLVSLLCLWFTLWVSNSFTVPYTQKYSSDFEDIIKTSPINWQTDLEIASQYARKNNKKIIVDVWAEWCAACLEMESTTWKNSDIIKTIGNHFVAVKLNYTQPTETLSKTLNAWTIVGLPAILILDPKQNNKPLEINQGIMSTKALLKKLTKYSKDSL